MFDADTIRILEHMIEHRPDLCADIELHSVEHDVVNSRQAEIMWLWCKRPSNLGRGDGKSPADVFKGTPIWQLDGRGRLKLVVWDSLQGHPKVVARRKRSREAGFRTYRMGRRGVPIAVGSRIVETENVPEAAHWYERAV